MSLIHNHNFRWYHYRDDFLSYEECDTIIKKIDNAEQIWSNSKLEKNVQLDEPELVKKYWGLFTLVNTLHYQFDISGVQRNCVYGKKYSHEVWTEDEHPHTDFAAGEDRYVDSTTKFTCVTYLSDGMRGGGLVVGNNVIPVKRGRAIIFPSFANHKVTQFYDKDRYVLINFAEGNTFK